MNQASAVRWTSSLALGLVLVLMGTPARAQELGPVHRTKLDAVVREAVGKGQAVRAIVRFHNDAALLRGASIVAGRGGRVRRALASHALNVFIDASTVDALAMDAGVAAISIDAEVRASVAPGWGAAASNGALPRQSSNKGGRGIAVAVIDSGVSPHSDLPPSRIRTFVDFVNGRTAPYDDYGHGTHVAGILAGMGDSMAADQFAGSASDVDVVALKVLDARGSGKTSDVIAALEWVALHHLRYNIRVVNLSLGHPVFEPAATDPLVQAAEALVRRGIVVVASAGNRGVDPRDGDIGYGGISSPANGPSIVAVGAVDTKGTDVRSDDRVTDYSSRGPTRFDLIVKPDLVAPGHRVVSLSAPGSALFDSYPALHVIDADATVAKYMQLSGTSMAAPAVAGAAALMLDANPGLSAGTVRAVLEFTAERLPDTDLMTQGAGYLNTPGAVRLAGLLKPHTQVGSVWLRRQDGVPAPYDELAGEQITWGRLLIWGDHALLGDFAYLHMAGFNDDAIWGKADNIVWGEDNIVWGEDNIVWGEDNIVWGELFDIVVWGRCETSACDNIVWGEDDNIVWGEDNIVWGEDNIVWGEDNIVWGETVWSLATGSR